MQLIVLRPGEGGAATMARAAALGLAAEHFPLFEVHPLAWTAPAANQFDALLVGSANVFACGGAALKNYRQLPVHAVGASTAAAATEAGFVVERVGEGGLQDILDRATGSLRYLRLAGAEHVELQAPPAVQITLVPVYAVAALPLPTGLQASLRSGKALVLLHSAAAARHFAAECDRLGIARNTISLAALGPRIADAAGHGWAAVGIAPQPADAALLEMARDMCH